jgi:hypothetical protein
MLLPILVLVALLPLAIVGFLYREAHIDLRQALVSAAATVAATTVLAGIIAAV